MVARRGNRARQNKQARGARRSAATPTPAPIPRPAAPRPPAPPTTPRRGLPPNSAQARAQRFAAALDPVPDAASRRWADILAPTPEARAQRDRHRPTTPEERMARARREPGTHQDPMAWWALEMAKDGQDVYLLPYQPTPSINPPRPRTHAAGYDEATRTLRIRFRNGQVYGYYNVPPRVWSELLVQPSIGRYINRVLNFYPYAPEPDLDIPTGLS
ncbi:KTSC domain-containing protein [Streptosporangium sandarakinum]